jgi:hypothetical protein
MAFPLRRKLGDVKRAAQTPCGPPVYQGGYRLATASGGLRASR